MSASHLPFDYARCHGGAIPLCADCLRRTAPWGPRQPVLTDPPHEEKSCGFFIAPRMSD